MEQITTNEQLEQKLYNLQTELEEARRTIKFLRTGQVNDIVRANEVHTQNVSDRKRLAELFKYSEEKRNLIMQAALDAIICINREGKIIFWNPSAEKIFGWNEEEVNGRILSEIIIPQQFRSMHDRGIENYLKTGEGKALNVMLELSAINRQNMEFPIELTVLPIKQAGEEFFCAFIRDISGRKKSEQLLKNSYERLKVTFNSSCDVLFDWDLETNQVVISDVYAKEYGYLITNNMTPANDWAMHIHPHDKEATESNLYNAITAGETNWSYDYRFLRHDGTIADVRSRANILRNEEGRAVRVIGSMQDLTSIKKLQQDQLNSQHELLRAVVDAQERERAAVGAELHDNVNQLLATSNMYLSIALTRKGDHKESLTKSQEYIAVAIEEVRKLSHALVGPTQDKIMGLVVSVEDLIHDISYAHNIAISFTHTCFREERNEVGLKLIIYRIIQEQINNILKHAKASQIVIELKKEGKDLVVCINDNGKGFDTNTPKKGIGLKNIHNRAKLYNGTVQIFSFPGAGCKMKIIFKSHGIGATDL